MTGGRLIGRFAAATLSIVPFLGSPAKADQDGSDLKEACAASYEQAQTLRRASKLTLARVQLEVCRKTCPTELSKDCRRWGDEVDREMPRVVLEPVDRGGNSIAKIDLNVDGELREAPPDGELKLDPGSHRLIVRVGDERKVVSLSLRARERQRLRIAFESVEPTVPESPNAGGTDPVEDRERPFRMPPVAFGLAAFGLVCLGTGAFLGIKGHVDRGDLRSRCAPNCEQDEVDAIERDWTIAAIAAGVGAVATGVGVFLVIDANRETSVRVRPTQSGAIGVIGGRF